MIQSPIFSPIATMKMRRDAEMRAKLQGLGAPLDLGDSNVTKNHNVINPLVHSEEHKQQQQQKGSNNDGGGTGRVVKRRVVVVKKLRKKDTPPTQSTVQNDQKRLLEETDSEIKRMETRLAELKLLREIHILEEELKQAGIRTDRPTTKPITHTNNTIKSSTLRR
jgi:hypothetical protein